MNIETAQPTADRPLISFHSPGQWNRTSKANVVFSSSELLIMTLQKGVLNFLSILTHNEENKQFMLQVTEANREAVPTESTTKSVIDALTVTPE